MAEAVKTTPWWWEAAPPAERGDALPGRIDVAVIGAGYTGLSAAIQLARAGRSVVALDAEDPGSGASKRNGGMIGSGHRVGLALLEKRYGRDRGVAVLKEGLNALAFTTGFIEQEGIECGFRRCGRFRGAWTAGAYDAMAREIEELSQLTGLEAAMVSKAEVRKEVATDKYQGGCIYLQHGGLHPGLFHQGLLDRAEAAGATVIGRTPVTRLEKDGKGFRLTTPRGTIAAGEVVVATNGYSGPLLAHFRRRIVPVPSYVIATEELGENRVKGLIPGGRMIVESRARHCYYRPSPDGKRILFGARPAAHHIDPVKGGEINRRILVDLFPELKSVAVSHAWRGNTGMSYDDIPHLGKLETGPLAGVHFALGYSGSGVAMAPYLGYRIAHKLLGDSEGDTAFDGLPHPAVPFYWGWPWFLPFVSAWYRIKDLREGSV
ncbi:MAG: FAD-binding oxidoreductase [Rhodovibrionaceae bacterium]